MITVGVANRSFRKDMAAKTILCTFPFKETKIETMKTVLCSLGLQTTKNMLKP